MKNQGFTLIELIVVIAIIGILATIVMVAINPERLIQNTNDTKARSELNQVKTSLQLYFNEKNSYPSDTPVGAWITELESGKYIRKVPTSPAITYGESGTNYDAWITVNNFGNDEYNSFSKCTSSDGDETGSGNSEKYFICPD